MSEVERLTLRKPAKRSTYRSRMQASLRMAIRSSHQPDANEIPELRDQVPDGIPDVPTNACERMNKTFRIQWWVSSRCTKEGTIQIDSGSSYSTQAHATQKNKVETTWDGKEVYCLPCSFWPELFLSCFSCNPVFLSLLCALAGPALF